MFASRTRCGGGEGGGGGAGEDGGEGVELESVDDVAGVNQLQTHETETNKQQDDVQHLGDQRQPQHPCRHRGPTHDTGPTLYKAVIQFTV